MKLTRRSFLKLTGASVATTALVEFGYNMAAVAAEAEELRTVGANTAYTICPYCSCGCGAIIYSDEHGHPIAIDGDPDHPTNLGSLCSKGASMFQVAADSAGKRNTEVLYRGPGGCEWEERTWDDAITDIARKIKDTRDKYFIEKDADGNIVNRVEAIASLGGAAVNNEECYLWVKAMRTLGLVYIDHQARI